MSKLPLFSFIFLFLFFLPISYFITNMFWFIFVEGVVFIETDLLFPFTTFQPPFIHDCCGDHFARGWDEQRVTQLGKFFIGGMIVFATLFSAVFHKPIKKMIRGIERDFLK